MNSPTQDNNENPAPVGVGIDSIVLEEEIDPNYVPSDPEVTEYAKWLGMDLDLDKDLFWIAREGLMAPLPKNWKPCKTKDTDDIYYFNFSTGESTWDHPCDGYYKKLYEEEKKKKEVSLKESGDKKRSKAKQDVEQLLGKSDKKKKKSTLVNVLPPPTTSRNPSPLGTISLEKKPLPDIFHQNAPLGSQPKEVAMSAVRSSDDSGVLSMGSLASGSRSKVTSRLMTAVVDSDTKYSTTSVSSFNSPDAKFGNDSEVKVSSNGYNSDTKESDSFKSNNTNTSTSLKSNSIQSADDDESQARVDIKRMSSTRNHSTPAVVNKRDLESDNNGNNAYNLEEDRNLVFKVRELQSSLNTSIKSNDRMQEQIADLERRLSRSQENLAESQTELRHVENSLNKEISDYRNQLLEEKHERDKQLLENEGIATRLRQLEQQSASSTSASTESDVVIKDYIKAGRTMTARIEELESENVNISSRLRRAQEAAEEQSRQQLAAQESSYKVKIRELENKLSESEELLLSEKGRLSRYRMEGEQSVSDLTTSHKRELSNLNAQLQDKTSEIQRLIASASTREQQHLSSLTLNTDSSSKALLLQLEEKTVEAKALSDRNRELEMELASKTREWEHLAAQCTVSSKQLHNARSDLENVESKCMKQERRIKQLEFEYSEKEIEIQRQESKLADLKRNEERTREDLQTQIQQLRKKLLDAEESSQSSTSTAYSNAYSNADSTVAMLTEKLQASESTVLQQGKEMEVLKRSVRTVEDERNATLRKSSQQETELRQAMAELTKLAAVSDKLRQLQQDKDIMETELQMLKVEYNKAVSSTVSSGTVSNGTVSSTVVLERQVEKQLELIKTLQGAVDSRNTEIVKAEEYLEKERVQVQKKEKVIRGYQEELMILQKKFQDLQEEYRQLQQSTSSSLQSNSNGNGNFEIPLPLDCKQCEVKDVMIESLKEKYNAINEDLITAQDSVQSTDRHVQSMKHKLAHLEDRNSQLLHQIESLEKERTQISERLFTAELSLRDTVSSAKYSEEMSNLKRSYESLLTEHLDKIKTYEHERQQLMRDKFDVSSSLQSSSSEAALSAMRIHSLEAEHKAQSQSASVTIASYQETIRKYQEEILALQEKVAKEEFGNERMKSEQLFHQKLLDAKTHDLQQSQSAFDNLTVSYNALSNELFTAKSELQRLKLQITALQDQLRVSLSHLDESKQREAALVLASNTVSTSSSSTIQQPLHVQPQPQAQASAAVGGMGAVELGLLFGQQIAAVQRLEAKLQDTEKLISHISLSKKSSEENLEKQTSRRQMEKDRDSEMSSDDLDDDYGDDDNNNISLSSLELSPVSKHRTKPKTTNIKTKTKSSMKASSKVQAQAMRHHRDRDRDEYDSDDDDANDNVNNNDNNESTIVRQLIEKFAKSQNYKNKHGSGAGAGGAVSSESGSSYWIAKVLKERAFLDKAQIALKNEKDLLRRKQDSLTRLRDQWKTHASAYAHTSASMKERPSSQKAAKVINKKTQRLNTEVQEWRRCNEWIQKRASKLKKLEASAYAIQHPSSNSNDPLYRICQELDEELISFGVDTSTTGTESDLYEPISGKATHTSRRDRGDRERDRDTRQPREEYRYWPNGFASAEMKQQQKQQQNVFFERSSSAGPMPAPQGYYSRDLQVQAHPHVIYVPPPAPVSSEALLRKQTTISDRKVKRELNELTNQQHFHEHVYDSHAIWLESLRKELNGFSGFANQLHSSNTNTVSSINRDPQI